MTLIVAGILIVVAICLFLCVALLRAAARADEYQALLVDPKENASHPAERALQTGEERVVRKRRAGEPPSDPREQAASY